LLRRFVLLFLGQTREEICSAAAGIFQGAALKTLNKNHPFAKRNPICGKKPLCEEKPRRCEKRQGTARSGDAPM